jgi:dihydrofolate synthase/folylpolyglutamate synthase
LSLEAALPIASVGELFSWIEGFTNLERSGALFSSRAYQLDRMRRLLERFGSPQDAFRSAHIAGSKGKGSTAALLAWSLQASGQRTGLYTSPHVDTYLERFAVLDGGRLDHAPDALLELGRRMQQAVEGLPRDFLDEYGPPTTFELLTLLAFCLFRDLACPWAVLETGIGGRLDATNTVSPKLCLITPIEREHTEVLGDTLQAIAREKAGIIKPGVPVYSAPQDGEVREMLRSAARERASPISFLDEELESLDSRYGLEGTEVFLRFRGEPERRYTLTLIGDFQAENAALVDLAARRTLGLDDEALRLGLRAAWLPGRLELLSREPPVVMDGAHTPRSVSRVLAVFRALFGSAGVLLFGAAKGKNTAEMSAILAPAFERIVITAPGSFKESEPELVHRQFLALRPSAHLEPRTAEALTLALHLTEGRRPLLVLGSFYLAGEVRRAFSARGQSPGR